MSSTVKDIQTKAGWILGHVLDGTDEEVGTIVAQGSVRALRDILVLGNTSAALVPLRVLGKVRSFAVCQGNCCNTYHVWTFA